MSLSGPEWALVVGLLAALAVVFFVRRCPPKCSECGRRTSWRSNANAAVRRWPMLAWLSGACWRYAVCRCGHVDYSMQVEPSPARHGALTERDRVNLEVFLAGLLDDYKYGLIEHADVVSALMNVIAEIDVDNAREFRRWLEQGRKLVRSDR